MNTPSFKAPSLLFWIACCLSSMGSVYAENDMLEMTGQYVAPSTRCTYYDRSKDTVLSCEDKYSDCLQINANSGLAQIELFSTQAYLHTCSLNATARSDQQSGRLVVESPSSAEKVSLRLVGDEVQVSHFVPPNSLSAWCGAHANLDGLKFSKVSRQVAGGKCAKD